MQRAKCLTNLTTCPTVCETYPAPNKANCGKCANTHHSSDPALQQPVDGLRRIIPNTQPINRFLYRVYSDPTAHPCMGRFLLMKVSAI